jgi:IclR family transcriptional regulator, acetate operon repressor
MIHYTDYKTAVNVRPEAWLLRARNNFNADEPQDDTAGDGVRAVDRALDILLAFKPQDDALTVSELLRRVELSRPTLYRLLRTLQRKQFLIASGDPLRFRLGPAVAQLSHVWTAGLDLGTAAQPMMRRLRDETGETVALFIPEGAFRLCIAEMPSSQALSFRRGVGYRERLTVGASGKVILAYMSPSLPKVDFEPRKFDPKKYARELALIKERGFAISKEELIQGAVAVSAPFFDGAGRVAGSLSVFGPSARLGPSQIAKFGKLLLREAQELSQVLGKSKQ